MVGSGRSVSRRACAALVSSVAFIAGVGGSGALAQETPKPLDPADQVGAVRDRAAVERSLSSTAIDYYVKRYDVSDGEARERLVDQYIVIGLAPALSQRLDGQVGEPSYDNERGEWVVPVTDVVSRDSAESALS